MLRKILFICVFVLPVFVHAESSADISSYLVGKWKVESVKKVGSTEFKPPIHPMKWEFTHNGKLIEELGSNGAKVQWGYHVVGGEIKVRLGNISFSWKILSMQPNVMLIRHQLGILKVIRI